MLTTPPTPFAEAVTEIDELAVVSRDPSGDARTSANGPGDTREIRNNLREIVIESTRSTLVQHIRRRHQLVLVRKLLVIFMALGLASSLYTAHFINGVPLKYLAWGATAIGLIGLLGMVQIWSRAARQQKRLQGARLICPPQIECDQRLSGPAYAPDRESAVEGVTRVASMRRRLGPVRERTTAQVPTLSVGISEPIGEIGGIATVGRVVEGMPPRVAILQPAVLTVTVAQGIGLQA